jgi:hypothetical protein
MRIAKGERLTGPERGPILNKAIEAARCSIVVMSAIVPPPRAIGVPPANPEMNRKTMNWAALWLSAVPTIKATKITLEPWYTGTRPYISLSGDMNMGPIASPSTYRVIARVLTVLEVMSRAAAMSWMPGAHIVGAIFLMWCEHMPS